MGECTYEQKEDTKLSNYMYMYIVTPSDTCTSESIKELQCIV